MIAACPWGRWRRVSVRRQVKDQFHRPDTDDVTGPENRRHPAPAVDEDAVRAVQVLDQVAPIHEVDERVSPADPLLCDDETVALDSPDGEREIRDIDTSDETPDE